MKQLNPDLANTIVQTVGWNSIKDTESIVTKKNVESALQFFDKEMLTRIEQTYKNDVKKRIRKGITTPRAFMTLLRRVLKRHKVSVLYDKEVCKGGAYFKYRLVH